MVCTSLGSLLRPLFYFLDDVSYPQSLVTKYAMRYELSADLLQMHDGRQARGDADGAGREAEGEEVAGGLRRAGPERSIHGHREVQLNMTPEIEALYICTENRDWRGAWPAVAGCSQAETFSQLSAISFAQPCICCLRDGILKIERDLYQTTYKILQFTE